VKKLGMWMLTLWQLDAIGIWETEWADKCMVEANRFWIYSLVFSIIWGSMQLRYGPSTKLGGNVSFREMSTEDKYELLAVQMEAAGEREILKRRLVTDCFDLFIPGHAVGWIRTSSGFVGFASVVSTTLSAKDVWDRVR